MRNVFIFLLYQYQRESYKAAYSKDAEQLGFSHDSFGRGERIGGGGRAATHGRKSSRALLIQLSGALEIRCDRLPDWIEGIKALN